MSKTLLDSLIRPNWPAPANVQAIQTTRLGGVSLNSYESLNLGDHVKDNPHHVAHNRQLLNAIVPTEPVWLNQVHGVRIIDAAQSSCIEHADGSFTTNKNVVCVTMTADCLPVLICDGAGTTVAAVHAGWRSLCDGVIEEAVKQLPVNANELMAWLGPAIGPNAFEVGAEVRAQFVEKDKQAESAFKPKEEKWLGDLYQIAQQRLNNVGVKHVYGGHQENDIWCTYTDENRFFSFRRDGDTGRMATMIWLTA
jgi:polyphenol oxidase